MKMTQARIYSDKQDYNAFSAVRLNNNVCSKLGRRGTWVCICNLASGSTIYRMTRGSSRKAPLTAEQFEIDYEGLAQLEIPFAKNQNDFRPCDIEITKANQLQLFAAHWRHPDPAYRVPMRLGIISLGLGLLSLVISVMSLQ